MAIHNELGRWGEDYAADFLAAQGYRIVERNWRFGHHDIDIIAICKNEGKDATLNHIEDAFGAF